MYLGSQADYTRMQFYRPSRQPKARTVNSASSYNHLLDCLGTYYTISKMKKKWKHSYVFWQINKWILAKKKLGYQFFYWTIFVH